MPAVPSGLPQVQSFGGPVMTAPVVQSITFPGYDEQMQADDLIATIGSTSYWKAAVGEYGVGAATAKPAVHLTEAAPSSIDDSGIQTWLQQKVAAGGGFMAPSANSLYVIFYPSTTTVTLQGSQSCQTFGGYHNSTTIQGVQTAYAVVPECTFTPMTTLQTTTGSASHELAEAATDPLPESQTMAAYAQVDQDHFYWEAALGGGEVGDMCAQFPGSFFQPPGYAYTVQRIWSNHSVTLGKDPCQPELPGETYVNAVPTLSDTVNLTAFGQTVQTLGVKIPQGTSKAVPVQLYSEAALATPITVKAVDYSQAGNHLTFSWNKTTGQNGDTLILTITVNTVDSSFGGNAFVIESVSGSNAGYWVGYVGQ